MKKVVIQRLSQTFEETVHVDQDVEYWMARDLQRLFEYTSWDNFLAVIAKAKMACLNSKQLIDNHFREVMKMVVLGDGAKRDILDFMLSYFKKEIASPSPLPSLAHQKSQDVLD